MTHLESALSRWVSACRRRPWRVLIGVTAAAALSALATWQAAHIDSDLSRLIRPPDDLQWFQFDDAFKAAFPMLQQTAVVVVSGADPDAVDRTTARLSARLRGDPAFDFVFAPGADPFLRAHRLYYLDRDDLERWLQGLGVDYGALLRLSEDASLANAAVVFADQVSAATGLPLPDPLATLALSLSAGNPAAVSVRAHPPLAEPDAGRYYGLIQVKGPQRHDQALSGAELVAALRAAVTDTPPDPGTTVRLTGEVVLAHEEISMALQGIGIAGSVSLLLLAAILGIGIGSARVIIGIFVMLALGTALTLGFATAAVGTFNTLALMFVVMFFGLGVDFAVHYVLRVREARTRGEVTPGPCEAAARDVGPALILCMATSAIAFLSFAPTAYRGLAELGIISAGGMVVAVALTLSVIPALFQVSGLPAPAPAPRTSRRTFRPQPWRVLAVTAVLALTAFWWARDLRFDYSILALRDSATEGMSTLLELQESGTATDYSISVLAPPDDTAALSRRLAALPEVSRVSGPDDWIPPDQAGKRQLLQRAGRPFLDLEPVRADSGDVTLADALDYLEEVEGAVAAEHRATYEALLDALRRIAAAPEDALRQNQALEAALRQARSELNALLLAEPFTRADLPADIRQRLIAADGRWRLSVEPAASLDSRAATARFIQAVAAVAPNYAGRAVVEWGVGDVVVMSFLQAAAMAAGAIAVLLLLYFRSSVLALLVLTPLLLTILFTFAIAEALGLSLNMANILVVPLIFGLGVDTGIHVVHRFTRGPDLNALLHSSTTRAVIISGLTTIGTFLSLSFSPHKGAASVGLLLALAISVMLLVTYLVLPALLQLAARGREPAAPIPP